jgi:hypothetical protein
MIEKQSQNKNYFLKQEVFKDELFKCDLSSIGDLNKEEKIEIDPMKIIPNSIRRIIEAKDKKKFSNNKIIFEENDHPKKLGERYVWKRLVEIRKEFNLIRLLPKEPTDQLISNVIQGYLGNCYFLSAIGSFSEESTKIFNLFPDHYDLRTKSFKMNANGLYEIQVYIHGKPIKMLIDDYFPCLPIKNDACGNSDISQRYQLAFSIIDEKSNNIWPLILEKAWSKANGNYGNTISGNILQAFNFISPSPVIVYPNLLFFPDKIDEFHSLLNDADDKNYLICADISCDINPKMQLFTTSMGLIQNHAYSVISIIELETQNGEIEKLLKIRNPWGSLEWNGDWSDHSPLWTDNLKKEAGYSKSDDGSFFMNFKDFLKFFTTSYICTHQIMNTYTFKKIRNVEKNSFFYFDFDLFNDIDGYFVLNLKSSKVRKNLKNDPNFENHYFSIFLFKKIPSGKNNNIYTYDYILLDSSISNRDRQHIKLIQEAGKYIILIKINEFDHEDNKNLNFNQKDLIDSMENYITEKLDKKVNFRIGLYSNLKDEDYKMETIENKSIDANLIKIIFTKALENFIAQTPSKNFLNFENENEKDTFRILDFKDKFASYGTFLFNNESNAIILEKISMNNIQNISFIPILDENIILNKDKIEIQTKNLKDLEIEENPFDDDNENEYLKCIKETEKFNSSVDMVAKKNIRSSNLDDKNKKKEIIIEIKPNSKFYSILLKNSENTDFDINSLITLKYPLSQIWQEKLFHTKKTKLKFKETYIPIIETIVKFNHGILIKYKNKTNEFIGEIKIKMQNMKNLKPNKDNLKYIEKIYGEESEGIIKIFDDGSCMIVINPGELAFVEYSSVDIFEEISYDINFSYNIYTV